MIERIIRRSKEVGPLFHMLVVIPTLASSVYFGFLASDVYISESRYVVRSPEKPATTGFGILLKSTGFTTGGDEVFAAHQYLESRDALRELNQNGAFLKAFGDKKIPIYDRFDPFGFAGSFEDLYKYYRERVSVKHDTTSSITTLVVKAYEPQVSRDINERLLEMAEANVNRLNTRGRDDLIRFAQVEVNDAKIKARNAAEALSSYRNKAGVVDPERQAQVQMQMIAKLQDELIATKTQLLQTKAIAPKNPQIKVLNTKIAALSDEIDQQTREIAGSENSLSTTSARYQRLILESQFADKNLSSAMASLEEAKNEARRKQAYVERIVQPNTPDEPMEPKRLKSILATLVMGLIAWGVATMMIAGVREHRE